MDANHESEEVVDCRNAIENIGLIDDMSANCASLKSKTMANRVDIIPDSVPLQNGDHSSDSTKLADNPKSVINGSGCKCDEEVNNHFEDDSKYSVNNNTINDNLNNNSVNEAFNESEAVVMAEEIITGVIEVISEEQIVCENSTEETETNELRTNDNSVCDEDMCDLEVSKTIEKRDKYCINSENSVNISGNRFVPSIDIDGENSSLSESSSQLSQSSTTQPTPNPMSNITALSVGSVANALHNTFTTASNTSAIASHNSHNESTNVSSVSTVTKKMFGKFRILNKESEDIGITEPLTHSDDTCLDSKFNKMVSLETMSTQSESSLHDNSEHSSASPVANSSPNKSNKETKRRGRPTGSTKKDKHSVQLTSQQLLLEDEDLSRRRSSRLKTLEARKEQEKAFFARHRDIDDTSGDSSLVNNSDANESQYSMTESLINTKQKKKKSKKDKNKDKESDSKKGKRKKKLLGNFNSFDDQKHESKFKSDAHKNQSNIECFTPPLPPTHYQNFRSHSALTPTKSTIDNDESSPRPEKVKSRWRRNSELESGHGFSQSAQTVPIIIPKETEPPPPFDAIDDNIYLFERKKSKTKKESRRMVCDCILTKEERNRGLIGCGDDCLNRMLMIECGSRCALGDHCANKRFQKKQCAKVEPFRTSKKGWGLRTLEPLQPNSFIMEYIGEVIDPLDFHNRTQKYSKEKIEHHYFMALKSDEIIDATVKGNITRFVNHSCDPNSETQKWTVNGDLRVGFFTQRFVQAGEEITFDYQFQRYGKEAQKCFCDSVNCRGYIGAESASILTDGSRITPQNKITEMDESVEDEDILEDLALEEEIAKLSEGGGLRSRQQVLMLARLMVRAEDMASRLKLIDIIKGTVEIAYLRLLLDYHGLQLIWSWMVEVEDIELKAGILELLEILPIPNKTMLTDSKVYSVVERWSQLIDEEPVKTIEIPNPLVSDETNLNSTIISVKVEERSAIESVVPTESVVVCDSSQTTDDIMNDIKTEPEEQESQKTPSLYEICSTTLDDIKDVLTKSEEENKEIVDNTNKSSPRIELKGSSLSLVIKPRSLSNASKPEPQQTPTPPVVKTKPSISSMAQKLLLNWKELKEVFRIPRLERQKRHEDEKEADRRTKEVEERRARGLPVSYDKRGVDDRDYTIAGILGIKRKGIKRTNDSKDTPNKKSSNPLSSISTNLKVSKEEHRKMFEREVQQKDYMEALKRYHQQLAYYNAVYGQQYQQQQQMYSQESTLREQYASAYTAYEQYYQSDQNYTQTSVNYSVPSETTAEYMGVGSQESVEYIEDVPTVEENIIFGIETTPTLIPLTNFDSEPIPVSESVLVIDNVPNDCVVYSDCMTKTNTEENDSIFDSSYPPPGVFYQTPDGNNYFTPLPVDRKEKAVNIVFDNNITVPFACEATKSMTATKLPHNWRTNCDKNGNIYYYNKIKRKSQWFPPEEEKHISPLIEVPVEVTACDQKLSDNEDSTSVPEEMSSQTSPKVEEMDEQIEPTAPDSISIIAAELENTINSTESPPNLLQSILALEADPRKRRHLLNSVLPSTTTAAADTSSSAKPKKTFSSTRQIQEYFRNKMSEYVVHCLNPYRRPECKKGRILNNTDFKYLARKLTHTIMGKEIKQCKSLDNLSCNDAVKHKTKDYVKKYMARFGPFYKTENSTDRAVSPKEIVANDSND